MKRIVLLSFFALLTAGMALWGTGARAQFGASGLEASGPKIATDLDVAVIFHKMTGQMPKFENWAKYDPAYRKPMTELERQQYLQEKPKELADAFRLVTLNEPLRVKFIGTLSGYSFDTEGYVVTNFTEDTYFAYSFAGREYAIIPQGLSEHQWLPVTGLAAENIERTLSGRPGPRNVMMMISLQPTYANKDAPMELDGKKRYLISAKVADIALVSCPKSGPCKTLWSEGSREYRQEEKNELLNLKQ